MRCDVREEGERVTLHLTGRPDKYGSVDRLLITLDPYLKSDEIEHVVIDLTDVDEPDPMMSSIPGLELEAKVRGKVLEFIGLPQPGWQPPERSPRLKG